MSAIIVSRDFAFERSVLFFNMTAFWHVRGSVRLFFILIVVLRFLLRLLKRHGTCY